MLNGEDRFYTTKEISQILKVKKQTVAKWCKSGRLKAIKVGKGWRVKAKELRCFLNEEQDGTPSFENGST